MSLKGQRTTTTSMDWDDFKSLISKLERDREYKFCLLVSIGVFSGLRISDLLELRYHQFIKVSDDNQLIFINKYGTKPIDQSYVNVKLKELLRKYGIVVEGNASSHLFRKTLGNRVLRLNNYSSESVILLMELFSHSSPAMTKRYLGIREKQIMDVYDSVRL
jgi:integrase